jgi:hypothetical protein
MPLLSRLLSLAALAILLPACPGNGDGGPDAAPPDANPLCLEATERSDLPWIQETILTPSCSAFNACHKGRALQAGGLNLETGQTHAQLVGVDSAMFPQYKLVAPGDPENSYLMIILGHAPGPLDPDVGTMPYNSDLLCVEMREAIARWIAEGATP